MIETRIAIILVNWNGKEDTLECLASLRQDTYPNKTVVVVDNGSHDDSVMAIRAQFPEAIVMEMGANLGFAGGNNLGIRFALDRGADYIFLLNNDTTVEPGALTALVDAAETYSEYGLFTPVIYYYDKPEEAWFAGSTLDLRHGIAVHDNSRVPASDEPPQAIPWASGCAMLIRAETLRCLGGFDERYFLNWEDVDLSLRLRAQGKQVALVPAARIYHKVGRSFALSKTGRYYHVRNNLLLVSLHSGTHARRAARRVIHSHMVSTLRHIKYHRAARLTTLTITLRAILDHLRHRYGALPTPKGNA